MLYRHVVNTAGDPTRVRPTRSRSSSRSALRSRSLIPSAAVARTVLVLLVPLPHATAMSAGSAMAELSPHVTAVISGGTAATNRTQHLLDLQRRRSAGDSPGETCELLVRSYVALAQKTNIY